MKYTYFTPGPSQLYPTVVFHLKTALRENILSISHRGEFLGIFQDATEGLRKLLNVPNDYHIVFVASGTEAMERVIENTVEKKSFHFFTGSFGKRWYEIAHELQKTPQKYEKAFGGGFRTIPLVPKDTELICFTQNETSDGTTIDPTFIYKVAQLYPQALIALDIVSAVPYVDLDYTKLDCVFFSVQKLFGLPAGLGVIIMSPKALEKAKYLQKKGVNIGTYHNFPTLVACALKNQTPDTPNVLDIYLLGKVIADMNRVGIQKIRKETNEKAAYLYNFFDNNPKYKPFIFNQQDRSQTVITITTGENTKKITKLLKNKGIVVGNGYGPLKEKQIRIANFPAVTKDDIVKLLSYFI